MADNGSAAVVSNGSRQVDHVGLLLTAVAEVADTHRGLAQRREAMLLAMSEIIGADAGVWAWGRGTPESTAVVPVAVIYFGVDDAQRAVLMEWGVHPETDRTFRQPIWKQMRGSRSATTLWSDIFTTDQWAAIPMMRTQLLKGGWSSWLHAVRYSQNDTWSNFFLLRREGRGEFGRREAATADLVLAAVPWMQALAEESVPPEAFAGLTPRQRLVMLMLLDGMPRKTIAYRLEITEDTVGDHIKSIYAHFKVGSSGELAALFLRGR